MQLIDIEGIGELRLIRYTGNEAISDAFEFDVLVFSHDPDIVLTDVVGKPAHLKFGFRDERLRFVHGIVKRFEHSQNTSLGASYRLLLVPEAWRLKLRRNSRIFQEMTVTDIISKVLDDAGFDAYQLAVSGSYATREYCVQYRESDWDFINRLMEEEGILYFFEHSKESCKMVIGDTPSVHDPLPVESTLKYRGQAGALGADRDYIDNINFGEEMRSGKVTMRDYNFKAPTVSLEKSSAADLDDDLEIYDYPGNYVDGGAGGQLASVLLEAHQALRKTGHGGSNCALMSVGRTFTLEDSTRADFNIDYLVTRVEHRGSAAHHDFEADGEAYHNQFEVIPADIPFRALPRTPRPTINGIQTAIVTGPSGEEIHTDEHGRIKVQFHWDRKGKGDENSSCWVRVKQTWAGPGWGAVWIPRIGMEAIIDFIEGDPDRPLCTGTVYHGQNVPPYKLPDEKTKSTIKSNSSTGGDGFNELRFEDMKGSEEIYLHGQKDWNIKIENDKVQIIGHDEVLDVGNDQTIHVAHDRGKEVDNDQSEIVGRDKKIDVGRNHDERIGGDEGIDIRGNESLSVGGNRTVTVNGNHSETIKNNQTIKVTNNLDQTISGAMTLAVSETKSETVTKSSTEKVMQDKSLSVDANYQVQVNKDMKVTIKENLKEEVLKEATHIIGDKLSIQCGDATITIKKNGNITVVGKEISVKGSGPVKVEGKKLDVKSKGGVTVNASGKVKVKGGNVALN